MGLRTSFKNKKHWNKDQNVFQTQTIPNLGKLTYGIGSQDAILQPKFVNQ